MSVGFQFAFLKVSSSNSHFLLTNLQLVVAMTHIKIEFPTLKIPATHNSNSRFGLVWPDDPCLD